MPAVRRPVALTERLVESLDVEIREMGVGDPTLGKQVRKLVGAVGGRIERWRALLGTDEPWADEVQRSLYLDDPASPDAVACERIAAARILEQADRSQPRRPLRGEDGMTDDFAHRLPLNQIRDGERIELSADEDERARIADRLGLRALDRVDAHATLERKGEVVRARGRLEGQPLPKLRRNQRSRSRPASTSRSTLTSCRSRYPANRKMRSNWSGPTATSSSTTALRSTWAARSPIRSRLASIPIRAAQARKPRSRKRACCRKPRPARSPPLPS